MVFVSVGASSNEQNRDDTEKNEINANDEPVAESAARLGVVYCDGVPHRGGLQ